jgi:hypothetical protein
MGAGVKHPGLSRPLLGGLAAARQARLVLVDTGGTQMDVTYRPARTEDLEPGLRVVKESYNDLRGRYGLRPVAFGEPVFQRFGHAEDPTGLWIAEAEGEMIGFAFSWMRQRFWYLGTSSSALASRPAASARH